MTRRSAFPPPLRFNLAKENANPPFQIARPPSLSAGSCRRTSRVLFLFSPYRDLKKDAGRAGLGTPFSSPFLDAADSNADGAFGGPSSPSLFFPFSEHDQGQDFFPKYRCTTPPPLPTGREKQCQPRPFESLHFLICLIGPARATFPSPLPVQKEG